MHKQMHNKIGSTYNRGPSEGSREHRPQRTSTVTDNLPKEDFAEEIIVCTPADEGLEEEDGNLRGQVSEAVGAKC